MSLLLSLLKKKVNFIKSKDSYSGGLAPFPYLISKLSPEYCKIERFFATLKFSFNQLDFYNVKGINKALYIFRFYYNHIRVHQHLYYLTPSEAWDSKDMITSKNTNEIYYFSELHGVINGFYFKPK